MFPVLMIVISAPEAGCATAIPAIAATALTMLLRERLIVALPPFLGLDLLMRDALLGNACERSPSG
jgi:hypothetical protein